MPPKPAPAPVKPAPAPIKPAPAPPAPAKPAPAPVPAKAEPPKVGDVVNVRFRVTNVFDNGLTVSLVEHATETTGGAGLTAIHSISATHVSKAADTELVAAPEYPTGIANVVTPTPRQPTAPTPAAPAKTSTKP